MYTLLLGDSEVRAVRQVPQAPEQGGAPPVRTRIAVELSAARVHWHEGVANTSDARFHRPVEGYLKPLTIWLDDALCTVSDDASTLADCYGAVTEGTIQRRTVNHPGEMHDEVLRTIALPLTHSGPISLTLHMQARATWQFSATSIRIDLPPDAQFRQSMAC